MLLFDLLPFVRRSTSDRESHPLQQKSNPKSIGKATGAQTCCVTLFNVILVFDNTHTQFIGFGA